MIIHLAICDINHLSMKATLHFYFKYDNGSCEPLMTCRIVLAIRQFLRCAVALGVITLIIQRFNITHPAFIKSPWKHRTTFTFFIVSIITVWVLPFGITLPTMYAQKFYEPICIEKESEDFQYVTVLILVLYFLIMSAFMFGFSTPIVRRLNHIVKNIPGEIRHQMLQESKIRSEIRCSKILLHIQES